MKLLVSADSLAEYYPQVYDGVRETTELVKTEDELFCQAKCHLTGVWMNQFIKTADLTGIKQFEQIIGIVADPNTETEDFRRARLINRFSLMPPFTRLYLKQKIDELLKASGNTADWDLHVNYNEHELIIRWQATSLAWTHEITVTVLNTIPANLVFRQEPIVPDTIHMNEGVRKFQRDNNYRLGTTWFLGKEPFAVLHSEEVAKVPEEHSIQPELLQQVADFVPGQVAKIRINGVNDVKEITAFTTEVSGSTAAISYSVPSVFRLGAITKLELLDTNGQVLTESIVYIDNTYDAYIVHNITIKEGT